jgi:peptide/nickel transport system substrate-binding protein
VLSLLMSGLGVALLVAATTVGAASSATPRGGTLRVNLSGGVLDTLDPGLAYVTTDWQVLYSTQLLLVNYPNKAGQAGGQLFPEAAKAFPAISNHGRTVTFQLRSGLRFSDGSAVTAACFRRAWERILSPKMFAQYGIFDRLNRLVAGAQKFTDGKAAHISGIDAKGLTLTFHLTRPDPAFLSLLGMQWFGAVKPDMPYTKSASEILEYPSAGPYYIAKNRPGRVVVLKRNRYYRGPRPQNPDEIVINSYPTSNGEASLLQIERNQVDYDMSGVPAADVKAVAQKYHYPSRNSRFHVGTQTCVVWEAFNNTRPPTDDPRIRKALNYAIGRVPIIKLLGPYAGTPTDQILVPGLPGYRKLSVYGNYPNFAKARQVGGSALQNAAPIDILYNPASAVHTSEAQLIQADLQRIGLTANLVQQVLSGPVGTDYGTVNISRSGYCTDYFDPFDLINVNFDSRTGGYASFLRFRDASFDRKAEHAASLSGRARVKAYAALDRLLMTKYAPVAPLYLPNFRYLVSNRVHNIVFSHYYGGPILNALSVG